MIKRWTLQFSSGARDYRTWRSRTQARLARNRLERQHRELGHVLVVPDRSEAVEVRAGARRPMFPRGY